MYLNENNFLPSFICMSRREVHANDHLSALASWLDLSLLPYFSLKAYILLDFKSLGHNLSTGKKFLLNHEIKFFSFLPVCNCLIWMENEWGLSFLITHISCPFNFLPLDDYDNFLVSLLRVKNTWTVLVPFSLAAYMLLISQF